MAKSWSAPATAEIRDLHRSLKELEAFLRNGGGPLIQPRLVTTDTTLQQSDRNLYVNTTGGAVVVTLPLASTMRPDEYTVKLLAGSNDVTLARTGAEEIFGAAPATSFTWNTTGNAYTLVPSLVSETVWGWVIV